MFQEPNINQVLHKLRSQLIIRGNRTIAGLARTFRALDSYDRNRKVDREEFIVGLRENGVNITPSEGHLLFDFFDKDGSGNIDFDEFIAGVRGSPNSRRQAVIDQAFRKMDRDGNGCIEVADLRGVYTCAYHPQYISGEKTETQIFEEFLRSFNDKNQDGRVDKGEWDEYYAEVSASVDDDQYFIEMMQHAWRL